MPANAEVITQLVARINAREHTDVSHYFTRDFRLDQPGATGGTGHEGARAMLDAMLALADDVHVEVLDMIEARDRVAVRYLVTSQQASLSAAMLAIYRFEGGLVAEDWGLSVGSPWER